MVLPQVGDRNGELVFRRGWLVRMYKIELVLLVAFYFASHMLIFSTNVSKPSRHHYVPGVDFTKGFKTWHKFSTEIRFMLIPIIVLFIAHEFITGNF